MILCFFNQLRNADALSIASFFVLGFRSHEARHSQNERGVTSANFRHRHRSKSFCNP